LYNNNIKEVVVVGPGRERDDLRPTEIRVIARIDLEEVIGGAQGCVNGRCGGNENGRPTENATVAREQLQNVYREVTR
jgi:hypothetical protein